MTARQPEALAENQPSIIHPQDTSEVVLNDIKTERHFPYSLHEFHKAFALTLAVAALAVGYESSAVISTASADSTCVVEGDATCSSGGTSTSSSSSSSSAGESPQTIQIQPISSPAAPAHKPKQTQKPKHHSSKNSTGTGHPLVSFNMHEFGPGISLDGCGPTALADVVRDETGRRVNPASITNEIQPWYSPGNSGTDSAAFPVIASRYGLREGATNYAGAERAIGLGGVAIILAHSPSPFTSAGHYMVLDKFKNGRFQLADPNQTSDRHFDQSWWSAAGLAGAGVNSVWYFVPR